LEQGVGGTLGFGNGCLLKSLEMLEDYWVEYPEAVVE
jgi:hypothetical protein